MLTIKERNEIAFAKMRERFKGRLDSETVSLALGELVEYTKASYTFCDLRYTESFAEMTYFLMQNIGYDYPDAPVVLRYKTLNTSEGIKQALSDWDNRYEMGK